MKKLILVLCFAGMAGCSTSNDGDGNVSAPTKSKGGSPRAEESVPDVPVKPIEKQTYTALAKAFDKKDYKAVFTIAVNTFCCWPTLASRVNTYPTL